MNYNPAHLLIMLVLTVVIVSGYQQAKANELTAKKGYVYALCNDARQEIGTASEQICGDAQDKLNMEYMCDANNNRADNHCWVEVK